MINRTPLLIKQAVPTAILHNAVAVLVCIEIAGAKRVHRQLQMLCDRFDLSMADVNGTGFTGAAIATPKALEIEPVVKKISLPGIFLRKV